MQNQFTKQEARETKIAVDDLFNALPKKKRPEFIGHLNDIFLFLEAAEKSAPDELQTEQPAA